MGFANVVTVTVSTAGGSSTPTGRTVNLDWANGSPTAVSVTGSSSGSFAYTLQYSLDDPMFVPATSMSWINDPNATALVANSSVAFLYQQPLAAVRLNSTALTTAVLTMRVSQGSWL